MSTPKGWPGQKKLPRTVAQFATVNPSTQERNLLDVNADIAQELIATDAVEAGSSVSVINATGHVALQGDAVRFTSGALSGQEVQVYEVSANTITVVNDLSSAPATGVTFEILRARKPRVNASGDFNVSATFTEQATAADGGTLPALTKVVSGYDGSNVRVLATDANGQLQVDVLSNVLPTGAATAANQVTGNASLASIDSKLTAPLSVTGPLTDAQLRASAVPVSAASLPLPTGAATEATLSALNGKVVAVDTGAVVISAALPAGTNNIGDVDVASLPGTVAADITATKNAVELLDNAVATIASAIPSQGILAIGSDGTNARALKTDATGKLETVTTVAPATFAKVELLTRDYGASPVTTAAYAQLIASTSAAIKKLQIFDSSGEALVLAVGPAASEVDQIYIFPGGNGDVDLDIPAASRISIKAVSGTASVGALYINCLG